jgi:hypothetical protein
MELLRAGLSFRNNLGSRRLGFKSAAASTEQVSVEVLFVGGGVTPSFILNTAPLYIGVRRENPPFY